MALRISCTRSVSTGAVSLPARADRAPAPRGSPFSRRTGRTGSLRTGAAAIGRGVTPFGPEISMGFIVPLRIGQEPVREREDVFKPRRVRSRANLAGSRELKADRTLKQDLSGRRV